MSPAPLAFKPSGRALDILDTAIKLFNQEGVNDISTNRIAKEAGISTGNLHYHYRRKSDIYVAIYRLIQVQLYEALDVNIGEMTSTSAFYIDKNLFGTLWKYRFFFGSMEVFLTKSEISFKDYTSFLAWMTEKIVEVIIAMTKRGFMTMTSDRTELEQFASTSWILWTGWIHWETIVEKSRNDEESTDAILLRIIYRHHYYSYRYLTPNFAKEFKAIMDAESQRFNLQNRYGEIENFGLS